MSLRQPLLLPDRPKPRHNGPEGGGSIGVFLGPKLLKIQPTPYK
jgi:hypothetical protein